MAMTYGHVNGARDRGARLRDAGWKILNKPDARSAARVLSGTMSAPIVVRT